MKRTLLCFVLLIVVLLIIVLLILGTGYAQPRSVSRPKITGIDHVAFYTTSADANYRLYSTVLGIGTAEPIESGEIANAVASIWPTPRCPRRAPGQGKNVRIIPGVPRASPK